MWGHFGNSTTKIKHDRLYSKIYLIGIKFLYVFSIFICRLQKEVTQITLRKNYLPRWKGPGTIFKVDFMWGRLSRCFPFSRNSSGPKGEWGSSSRGQRASDVEVPLLSCFIQKTFSTRMMSVPVGTEASPLPGVLSWDFSMRILSAPSFLRVAAAFASQPLPGRKLSGSLETSPSLAENVLKPWSTLFILFFPESQQLSHFSCGLSHGFSDKTDTAPPSCFRLPDSHLSCT